MGVKLSKVIEGSNDSLFEVWLEEESLYVENETYSRWYKEEALSDSSSSMLC